MSINRHNYEEYFILYMDNELAPDERRMVEAFVQQHPDLNEELDNLLQYKMIPDTNIVFTGIEELIKENGYSLITATNYEEWLTQYVDEELSAEQKVLVEKYIAANPLVQKELALFQKSKLQPGTIVFNNKEALFRREEKVRRIPIYWRAAAAVLLLVFGISTIIVLNKKPGSGKDDVATTTNPGKEEVPLKTYTLPPTAENNKGVVAKEKDVPVITPVVVANNNKTNSPVINKASDPVLVNNKTVADPKNKLPESTPSVIKKQDEIIVDNKPTNNLPQPLNKSNTVPAKTENAMAYNKPEENKNPITSPDVTNKTTAPSEYIQASNNNSEELEQPEGKKNKNRGIFRKIARTFEKRTNIDPTDDNKLLVAGLSFKLK